MSKLLPGKNILFDLKIPVLVIGAGACGLTAALKAHDVGALIADHSDAMDDALIPSTFAKVGFGFVSDIEGH